MVELHQEGSAIEGPIPLAFLILPGLCLVFAVLKLVSSLTGAKQTMTVTLLMEWLRFLGVVLILWLPWVASRQSMTWWLVLYTVVMWSCRSTRCYWVLAVDRLHACYFQLGHDQLKFVGVEPYTVLVPRFLFVR